MITDPCPHCGHTTHPTHAVGRFHPSTTGLVFRAVYPDAPLRPTRADAEADQCRWQADADPRDPMPGQETLL